MYSTCINQHSKHTYMHLARLDTLDAMQGRLKVLRSFQRQVTVGPSRAVCKDIVLSGHMSPKHS